MKNSRNKTESQSVENKMRIREHPLLDLMFTKHYLITYRLFIIIPGTIFIIGGLGYLLDKQFQTLPAFTITGLILALPTSMIIIVKSIRDLSTKIIAKKNTHGQHS